MWRVYYPLFFRWILHLSFGNESSSLHAFCPTWASTVSIVSKYCLDASKIGDCGASLQQNLSVSDQVRVPDIAIGVMPLAMPTRPSAFANLTLAIDIHVNSYDCYCKSTRDSAHENVRRCTEPAEPAGYGNVMCVIQYFYGHIMMAGEFGIMELKDIQIRETGINNYTDIMDVEEQAFDNDKEVKS